MVFSIKAERVESHGTEKQTSEKARHYQGKRGSGGHADAVGLGQAVR